MLDKKIDWWLNHRLNVLFVGKHGVGKTALIKEAFDRHGLKWRYFSASTMDPWVDFIGVPKEAKNEQGKSYLQLIRPEDFADGSIEALFFDEFNRAPKKVRNAVMELIQFKSINGQVFPNLKVVWAAINPDDDEETYDVEKLDPAQIDRFHVKTNVPYTPDKAYFVKRFGSETGTAALNWWRELPQEEKEKVSPRRLDYAIQIFNDGGDIRDVISETANISKLIAQIQNGPIIEKLERIFTAKDIASAKALLAVENNFEASLNHIATKAEFKDFFFPQMPREKISAMLVKSSFSKYILDSIEKVPMFAEVAQEIQKANTNLPMTNKIRAQFASILKNNPSWTISGSAATVINQSPQVTIKNDLRDVQNTLNGNKDAYARFEAFDKIRAMLNDNTTYALLDKTDCGSMLIAVNSHKGQSFNASLKKQEVSINQVVQKIAGRMKELGEIKDSADFAKLVQNNGLTHLAGVTVNV